MSPATDAGSQLTQKRSAGRQLTALGLGCGQAVELVHAMGGFTTHQRGGIEFEKTVSQA